MFFKELISVWKGKDMLNQMYGELIEMLKNTEKMFVSVTDLLVENKFNKKISASLFSTDIEVNKTERNIRKQIVEHLIIESGTDIPACLVLMSVAKDVERIGDFCKNLLEVAEMLGNKLDNDNYSQFFKDLIQELKETFKKTQDAFAESDEVIAHDIIERELAIAKQCDEIIFRLSKDSLACRKAVCYTLVARYLKRICAHLGNVASSVVMPVHKIDYFDEKWH
jgi:phosphate uptake regulator